LVVVSISYLFHASQMPRWENVEGEEVVEEMDGTDTATYTAEEAITLLGWENVDWGGATDWRNHVNQEAGAEEVDWDEVVQD
jgi:hypothetical protein